MSVENSLQGVLTLLVVIVIGILLGRKGVIRDAGEEMLTRLTLTYSIPFVLFDNSRKYITPEFLREMGAWLLVPAAVILVSCGLALLLARLLRIKDNRRGMFMVMFSFSNTILIGLPIVTQIFGEQGVAYNIAFYIPNTVLFWTLGNMALAHDGGQRFRFDRATLRAIFSPALCGLLIGMLVAGVGLTLPPFLNSAIGYMADLTVPSSLLLTGVFLSKMGRGAFKLQTEGWIVLAGRLILAPALTLFLCGLFGAQPMLTGVYTVIAAMPVMNQAVLMARHYGGDYLQGAQMLTVTTLFSIVMTPALVYLLTLMTA